MKIDYAMIPQLHLAARRHRAQVMAGLFADAIVWIFNHRPRLRHAARPHFAR
jgi:hypothetical protein